MVSVILLASCYIFIDSGSVTWSGLPKKASRLLACQKSLGSSVDFSINPAGSNQSAFSAFSNLFLVGLPLLFHFISGNSLKLKFRFLTKQRLKLRHLRRNFANRTFTCLADSKHPYWIKFGCHQNVIQILDLIYCNYHLYNVAYFSAFGFCTRRKTSLQFIQQIFIL